MVSLAFIFWMYVVLFGIIGAMRGWAKELLVSFSVILAFTLTKLFENYVPVVRDLPDDSTTLFWLRTVILIMLVFFGYQTPNISRFAAKMTRERLQDALLGIVLGALNGYLIAGAIWFYMNEAKYPFKFVTPPVDETTKTMLLYLPPRILGIPAIYFAVALAFVFVLVVFI